MRLLIISSVGPKIQTLEIYEQTKKHAISKEFAESSPCYFLLDGFYLKSLLFIFRITQVVFDVFRTLQVMLTQEKQLLHQFTTTYGRG